MVERGSNSSVCPAASYHVFSSLASTRPPRLSARGDAFGFDVSLSDSEGKRDLPRCFSDVSCPDADPPRFCFREVCPVSSPEVPSLVDEE